MSGLVIVLGLILVALLAPLTGDMNAATHQVLAKPTPSAIGQPLVRDGRAWPRNIQPDRVWRHGVTLVIVTMVALNRASHRGGHWNSSPVISVASSMSF